MPDDERRPAAAAPAAEDSHQTGKKKLWLVLLVEGVLMLAIGMAVTLMLSSNAAGEAEKEVARIEKKADQIDKKAAQESLAELAIGDFGVTNQVAEPDAALQITFQVHLEVQQKDAEELAKKLEQRRFRIRQAIEVVARQATYKDIQDPALGLMKRQIRQSVNESLGSEAVSGVIISGFRTFEQ